MLVEHIENSQKSIVNAMIYMPQKSTSFVSVGSVLEAF